MHTYIRFKELQEHAFSNARFFSLMIMLVHASRMITTCYSGARMIHELPEMDCNDILTSLALCCSQWRARSRAIQGEDLGGALGIVSGTLFRANGANVALRQSV